MGRYEKSPRKHIDWLSILISAIVDLIVGILLILIDSAIG